MPLTSPSISEIKKDVDSIMQLSVVMYHKSNWEYCEDLRGIEVSTEFYTKQKEKVTTEFQVLSKFSNLMASTITIENPFESFNGSNKKINYLNKILLIPLSLLFFKFSTSFV